MAKGNNVRKGLHELLDELLDTFGDEAVHTVVQTLLSGGSSPPVGTVTTPPSQDDGADPASEPGAVDKDEH